MNLPKIFTGYSQSISRIFIGYSQGIFIISVFLNNLCIVLDSQNNQSIIYLASKLMILKFVRSFVRFYFPQFSQIFVYSSNVKHFSHFNHTLSFNQNHLQFIQLHAKQNLMYRVQYTHTQHTVASHVYCCLKYILLDSLFIQAFLYFRIS